MAQLIELFYLEDCPHWERAIVNVEKAMRLEGTTAPVHKVLVTSGEDARKKLCLGSPTIRIDGVDLDGREANRRTYKLGCRIYKEGDRTAGWPSVDVIRRALQREQE